MSIRPREPPDWPRPKHCARSEGTPGSQRRGQGDRADHPPHGGGWLLADRVAIIDHGRIVALDKPASLIERHAHQLAQVCAQAPVLGYLLVAEEFDRHAPQNGPFGWPSFEPRLSGSFRA